MSEKTASDAPVWYSAEAASAWADGFNAASEQRCSAVSVDQQLEEAGKAAIAIRNELDRTRVERDSWEAQFHSAAAAASEYSEFWEKHRSDFDQFGNYIPYSQMDGDLRAAKAEIERLRALPQTAPSDIERAFQDACDEAGCAYDNEALLEAIHALKERCQAEIAK